MPRINYICYKEKFTKRMNQTGYPLILIGEIQLVCCIETGLEEKKEFTS